MAWRWNGTTWIRQTIGGSGPLNEVSCSARRRCTAVGYDLTTSGNSLTLAERWNGRRWRIEPNPQPGLTGDLRVACQQARGPARRRSASAGGVRAGHHGGQVVGVQEGRWRRRAPGEEPAGSFEVLLRPQLIVDDAVQIGVVLGEVAGRVLEVPEEVRARVVAAESPDVPFGPSFEHRERAAAYVVDVVDLPGRVVQEIHRRGQDQDVVVIGRAAHERADILDAVADLEPEAIDEKRRRRAVVDTAEDSVTQLARTYPAGSREERCAVAAAVWPAGPVINAGGRRYLLHPGRDVENDAHPGHRLGRPQAPGGHHPPEGQAGAAGRRAAQGVGVRDAR